MAGKDCARQSPCLSPIAIPGEILALPSLPSLYNPRRGSEGETQGKSAILTSWEIWGEHKVLFFHASAVHAPVAQTDRASAF